MLSASRLGLRLRLILLVLVALLPVLGFILYTAHQHRALARDEAQQRYLTLARGAVLEQASLADGAEQLLTALAQLPDVRQPDRWLDGACSALMADLLSTNHRYANLGVIDTDGFVVCSALPFDPSVNLADRDYFRRSIATGGFSAGEYQVGRITGRATLNFAYPIRAEDDRITAVVYGALDLGWFADPAAHAQLPEASLLTLIDRSGMVLARAPDAAGVLGQTIPEAVVLDAVVGGARSEGSFEGANHEGEWHIFSFATLTDQSGAPAAYVVLSRASSLVFAHVYRDLIRNLALLGVVSVAMLGTAWVSADVLIMRQVRQLVGAGVRLSAGQHGARTGLSYGGGELGQLARSFDAMAADMEVSEARTARAEAERRLTESRLSAIVDYAADPIISLDRDQNITVFNHGAEAALGYSADEVAGKPFGMLLPGKLAGTYCDLILRLQTSTDEARRVGEDGQFAVRRRDGSEFHAEATFSKINEEGYPTLTVILRDITDRLNAEEALRRHALYDAVTGLPNRVSLIEAISAAAGTSATRPERQMALLSIGLNRFHEVNETFGFLVGDRLLRDVAPRIRAVVGENPFLARVAGDEFAVLIPDCPTLAFAVDTAYEIVYALERPFLVEGEPMAMEASAGIVLYPDHGTDPDMMLRRASLALRSARSAGIGAVLYEPERHEHGINHFRLLAELRHAIEDDELVLHYQPKVDLRTGRVQGAEALLRWQHPSRGLVPPSEFIPLAERTGLYRELTRWVLNDAIRQCRDWMDKGIRVPVAINVSARSFQDWHFLDEVRHALRSWDTSGELLDVEITETAVMADPERAEQVCADLREIGVSISIDDFGTGHSPLVYLKRLPVGAIKIDRSFVADIMADANSRAIAETVIALSRHIGLQVIAEGVEDAEVYALLAKLGCDQAQGYYIGRPMPANELAVWLQSTGGLHGSWCL